MASLPPPEWIKQVALQALKPTQDDVLGEPIGRTPDRTLDAALVARGLTRAELFTPGTAIARHREHLARMIAEHGLLPADVVATHWGRLKEADQTCAMCANKARCATWLNHDRSGDSPRKFCPIALLLERIRDRVSG